MSDRDPSRRSEIARKASKARWDGKPKQARRTEHKSSGVPERRFAATDPSRRSAWKHYVDNQGAATGRHYRPSYSMMTPDEVNELADNALAAMDAYGKGGSHVSLPEARWLHGVAQAAAISWFSR